MGACVPCIIFPQRYHCDDGVPTRVRREPANAPSAWIRVRVYDLGDTPVSWELPRDLHFLRLYAILEALMKIIASMVLATAMSLCGLSSAAQSGPQDAAAFVAACGKH